LIQETETAKQVREAKLDELPYPIQFKITEEWERFKSKIKPSKLSFYVVNSDFSAPRSKAERTSNVFYIQLYQKEKRKKYQTRGPK